MPNYSYEQDVLNLGYHSVCGIDEAGRGPLAGPVYAAAVILPIGLTIDGLNDSKKLSEKKREALYDVIIKSAVSYSVAAASEEEIDRMNILNATYLAMIRAAEGLSVPTDFALIDGNRKPEALSVPSRTIIKGDSLSMSIAAASILAKVERDRLMLEFDRQFPEYGFAKHKGYGTKVHCENILKYGPCAIHRTTFLKKLYNQK